MTSPLVAENTKASLDADAAALARRYGAGDRLPVVYRVPQQATSKLEDNRGGEVAVSNSNPPDQFIGLPTIPSGSKLFPPSVRQTNLTANLAGHGALRADLTVVKHKRPRIKRTDHIAQYRIAGEMFYVEVKGRRTYLRHPRWSLMGAGKTLANAEVALLDEAGLVVRVFGNMAAAELDEEAERMLNFARRIA